MKAWTVSRLAKVAKVSISWVHQEIAHGKFPGIEKFGNTYLIPYDEGCAWLESRGVTIEPEPEGER